MHFYAQTQGLADKGYQGLQKLHPNSLIPIKKPKNGSLSKEDKRFNRQLARQCIAIEHINRRLKIFKILSLPYRKRRRRFGLRCNLIAAIYNVEVGLSAAKSSISPPRSQFCKRSILKRCYRNGDRFLLIKVYLAINSLRQKRCKYGG